MISIKEYAKNHQISYEAVRKQVARYAKELEGHIIVENRTQLLDEYAEQFLGERRARNPVIVFEQAKADELEDAKREVENLRKALLEAQRELMASQRQVIELQSEKADMLEEKYQHQLLLEDTKKLRAELFNQRNRADAAEKEIQKFKPSIFGFYRKQDQD